MVNKLDAGSTLSPTLASRSVTTPEIGASTLDVEPAFSIAEAGTPRSSRRDRALSVSARIAVCSA